MHWTSKEWSKVLFSDKLKICMFGSDGIKYVRYPKGERFALKYQMPTVKHDCGNSIVWGCFCCDSIRPLHCIKSIMGQNVYLDKIKDGMLPHGKASWFDFLARQQSKTMQILSKKFSIRKKINFCTDLLKAQISIQ